MLSVIIATRDSERALVPTLAALVPGATAGLVREVIIADAGSRDETAAVADIAGCHFMPGETSLAARLSAAAAAARGSWLFFLRPGTVPEPNWVTEAQHFADRSANAERAAVMRPIASGQPPLRAALSLLRAALGGGRPEQGLLIAKTFYTSLRGHADTAADAEADLLRRIGRRRIVMLGCGATQAGA
jgi:glycosyltransferase involved in cell wall biosynthesis